MQIFQTPSWPGEQDLHPQDDAGLFHQSIRRDMVRTARIDSDLVDLDLLRESWRREDIPVASTLALQAAWFSDHKETGSSAS